MKSATDLVFRWCFCTSPDTRSTAAEKRAIQVKLVEAPAPHPVFLVAMVRIRVRICSLTLGRPLRRRDRQRQYRRKFEHGDLLP